MWGGRGELTETIGKKISWGMCLSAWSSHSNNKTSHTFCKFPCLEIYGAVTEFRKPLTAVLPFRPERFHVMIKINVL